MVRPITLKKILTNILKISFKNWLYINFLTAPTVVEASVIKATSSVAESTVIVESSKLSENPGANSGDGGQKAGLGAANAAAAATAIESTVVESAIAETAVAVTAPEPLGSGKGQSDGTQHNQQQQCQTHIGNNFLQYKTCVINDPLSQTYSPASSDHYFSLKFSLFARFGQVAT